MNLPFMLNYELIFNPFELCVQFGFDFMLLFFQTLELRMEWICIERQKSVCCGFTWQDHDHPNASSCQFGSQVFPYDIHQS